MNDQQFRQLLNHLGFSWSGYRKVRKGVKKRIQRHMNRLGCRDMAAYLIELDRNNETRKECELLMTVSISRFFRDREFWRDVEDKLLFDLIGRYPEKIKVWSAGCACGDEVYSFKIVWECLKKRIVMLPELEVLATDVNPTYLERARAGIYSASSLKAVQKEFLSIYFDRKKDGKHYAVKALLAQDVVWKSHHLLCQAPGSGFHIIFMRNNVLTYYENQLKHKAFKNVLQSLAPSGLLVIGSHEALPFATTDLVRVAPHAFVFRKEK
ncbi:MAG: hypothetical protein KKH68_04630 [Proteobacteria bacterium]|nr:hypothetical protein [Pseudomonadota bacterium]